MTRSILIIEDNAIIALDIERRLKSIGCGIAGVAATAAEALDLAEKKRPVLALVDIKLKGPVDGIEVATQLRDRFSIPFVFLTAHSDAGVKASAMATGPAGYLLKPLRESELEELVRKILT
ncbi:MAG: response regulator [Methanoregulaceae archaeon]|nr:response regulator [Methanoregulaceae archaeon]